MSEGVSGGDDRHLLSEHLLINDCADTVTLGSVSTAGFGSVYSQYMYLRGCGFLWDRGRGEDQGECAADVSNMLIRSLEKPLSTA